MEIVSKPAMAGNAPAVNAKNSRTKVFIVVVLKVIEDKDKHTTPILPNALKYSPAFVM